MKRVFWGFDRWWAVRGGDVIWWLVALGGGARGFGVGVLGLMDQA